MSFGERGYEALELAFRLGGFTPAQHARFTGTDVRRSRRILAPLSRYKLVEQAPIPTPGRSALFHHLSKKDGGKAIVMAAQRTGMIKEREASGQYKLFQLPARAEHHHERNEFYLALVEAVASDGGAEVPLSEMWGESYPEFPLRGEGRPRAQERENARMVYERIYPDGMFTVRWPDLAGLEQEYSIELEMRSRSKKVASKLDAYAGRWLRLQHEDGRTLAFEGFWPVIFVLPTRQRARAMRDRLRDQLREQTLGQVQQQVREQMLEQVDGGAGLGRYQRLRVLLKERGVSPGWFVLFTSSEEVRDEALGKIYRPLVRYDEDDEPVSLRKVARAAARLGS